MGDRSAMIQFTCLACGVGFPSSELQRKHYQTDWHRYNLKRKVAGMAPVSATDFRARVLAQQQLAAEVPEDYACDTCGKKFSSKGAYDNHVASKKHKENQKRVDSRQPSSEPGVAEPNNHQNSTAKAPGPAQKQAATAPATTPAEVAGAAAVARSAVSARSQLTASEKFLLGQTDSMDTAEDRTASASAAGAAPGEDPEAPAEPVLDPEDCIFCSNRATSLEDNLAHMTAAHSFFVPDLQFVTNLPGLIQYLQIKVAEFFVCLTCNGKGRELHSLEAVRKHMDDKGHSRIDYSDEGALEISEFYDFSSSYPDFGADEDMDADEELTPEARAALGMSVHVDESTMALVLPNGQRAGHRKLVRYYKQRFQPEDTRDSVVIQRLMSQYKAIGLSSTAIVTPEQRRARSKASRLAQKASMQVGIKQNKLQFHYREQVLQ